MDLLWKTPNESELFDVDFTERLADGETISSVTSYTANTPTGASALTIAGVTFSNDRAQARISGGTAGYRYHVNVIVVTSDGNTLEECGNLDVLTC